jgi:hypothetical protein
VCGKGGGNSQGIIFRTKGVMEEVGIRKKAQSSDWLPASCIPTLVNFETMSRERDRRRAQSIQLE